MAETLIIILAEHNVPINFADHFTKLVSNKLVFPDSVFLRMRAARAPCSLKVVIMRVVTIFFFQKLNRSVNILLSNIKIIWWMNIIVGIMDECDTYIDLTKYM